MPLWKKCKGRLLDWLSLKYWQLRSTGVGVVILACGAMGLLMGFVSRAGDNLNQQKAKPIIATINGFGIGGTRNPTLIVTAQDAQGLTGSSGARLYQIQGCHIGDKIRARKIGLALWLDPAPCPIHLRTDEAKMVAGK